MTLEELRRRVRMALRDPQGEKASDPEIDYYLNEAERQFATLTRCLTRSDTLDLVVEQAEYTLAADALELHREGVYYERSPSSSERLRLMDPQALLEDGRTEQGHPCAFWMLGPTTIRLYPIPAASTTDGLRVDVVVLPASMTADASVPSIPPAHHLALADYAQAQITGDQAALGRFNDAIARCSLEVSFGYARGRRRTIRHW